MLSLGYPLSGDLSLDGYRSENWLSMPISASVNDVIQMWLGDAEHTNTMLSQYRSDMGAAIAVGEDGNVICVIETALQTASGKMQYDAYPILTGIPQTQTAYSAMATEAARNGLPPQYSMPVKVSTAQPNGDVVHVVQYGQTLWSIAITYHTTIKQIQSLNHLSSIAIIDGQKLLVVQRRNTAGSNIQHDRNTQYSKGFRYAFMCISNSCASASHSYPDEGIFRTGKQSEYPQFRSP